MQHERIGRAGKIGNEGNENIVLIFEDGGGFHVLLPVIPVHIGVDDFIAKRKNVKRNDRMAARGEFSGNAHVRVGGE